ncbi:MAG: four-helix bundle copper-binding protein [Bacteroidetes bacterium]|nr:four-helix bundle copper-binding protein [Bacteroidota bacterium]
MAHVKHHKMSTAMQDCIKDCQECETTCTESIDYCLQLGGKHAEASHIRSLMDCAEICRTSAGYMLRGSEQYQLVCGTCAEVCERCEQSCRQFGDDTMMQECAEACRRTAQSCRQMAGTRLQKAA